MASIPLEIQAMVIAALGSSKNLSASETADIWGNVRFVSKFFLQEVETMFRKKFLPEVSLNLECLYFDEICRRLSSPIEPCPRHSSHQFIRAWAKNLGFDRIDATDCGRAIFKAGYMDSSSLTEEKMYDEKWMFESLDERIKYGIETRFLVEFQEVCYAPNIRRLRVDAAERGVSLNWKQLFCLFATVNSRAQVRLRLETEVEPVRTRLEAGAHTEEGSEAGVDREGVDEMGEQDEAVEEGDEEGVQDEASEEEGNEEEDDSGDSYGEEDADWDRGDRVLRRKYAPNE